MLLSLDTGAAIPPPPAPRQEDDQVKIKTTLAVIALTLAPGLAAAMCSDYDKSKITASSCQEGQTWDPATQTCTSPTSS